MQVLELTEHLFPRPPFFQGSRLNFAENLLYLPSYLDENSTAVMLPPRAIVNMSRGRNYASGFVGGRIL